MHKQNERLLKTNKSKQREVKTMNALIDKIRDYREYKRMIEELENLADTIADELKTYMSDIGQTKIIIGEYKINKYPEYEKTEMAFDDMIELLDELEAAAENTSLNAVSVEDTSKNEAKSA
jgi:uncharacterized protein YjiS (DUF1127 family)